MTDTQKRILPSLVVLGAALFGSQPTAVAQVSEYYLVAGDQSTFLVLQGGALIRSWTVATGTARYQYPLVVTDTVRTMGANAGEIGAEYDLLGNDLGARFTHPTGPSRCWDGTTDGGSYYAIDSVGGVYRFDRNWGNPVRLFGAGSIGSLTYDPSNDSLWVSQFSTNTITNYTMTGVVLGSFSTGHTQNMALALDRADGTLWLHDRTAQGTYEQWSTTGVLLARIVVPGASTYNALGGEIPTPNVAACRFRNGNGVNLPDFSCRTKPILGTGWVTSYNTNANTLGTVLIFGVAGPATGPALFQGEWLISLAAPPVTLAGTGDLTLPIPSYQWLAGITAATQGFRVDSGPGGPLYLPLNAQDIAFGY
ncbi:MAG: hypothetical protein IPM29_22075 [Planctomycetes bacterium]|nr:hypothetical protein [Planctomycetota bacterium]